MQLFIVYFCNLTIYKKIHYALSTAKKKFEKNTNMTKNTWT